jgi:guanylate kinase
MTGKAIIFSAPSGSGKTTLVRHLLQLPLNLEFSVSACSRDKRANEKNGVDYYFLGVEGFKEKITENAFIEWEEVYENQFYGTLKKEIERIWAAGNHVIFDVDVVGGLNLKKVFGNKALAVFVKAPSVDELEKRLRTRHTETEESIQKRLSKAKKEMSFEPEFDVSIVNDNLQAAMNQAEKMVSEFLSQ